MPVNYPKNPDFPKSENNFLKMQNLVFSYGEKAVLNDLNLSLEKNEMLGLAGKNGSGKTTLFRCITGLEKWTGQMEFLGRSIQSAKDFQFLRKNTGYVLQNPENQIVFPTVLEDVMFGPLNLGLGHDKAEERAFFWLSKMGLAGFENRLTTQLSGGEKRLLALAGILAMEPKLLLLDEPLNELDETACRRVTQVLNEVECACIVASHDVTLFEKTGCKVVFLENGKLWPDKNQRAI